VIWTWRCRRSEPEDPSAYAREVKSRPDSVGYWSPPGIAEERVVSGVEGKVVAITGASSGMGEATALLLAERGAKVALGARRSERLEALAARIAGAEVKRLLKGVLYGIAAALPVFRQQGFGHFVNIASTAAHRIIPSQSVYAATKTAVRVISEGLRQEAGDKLRVTVISPGFTRTDFAHDVTNPEVHAQIAASKDRIVMPPDAVARAIAFAIEQPANIDVGEIIVRPTAQS